MTDALRRYRLSLDLLVARRATAVLLADVVLLLFGLAQVLTGEATSQQVYAALVVLPLFLLGVPVLADAVSLERRSGSLDLALSSPDAPLYFERRVGAFAALAVIQSYTILVLDWAFSERPYPLVYALIQATLLAALVAAGALFWGVRLRTTGGVSFALWMTLAVLGRWTFSNPIPDPLTPAGRFVSPLAESTAWLANNLVLALTALVLYLYARRRLARPELLLSGWLLATIGLTGCAGPPDEPSEQEPLPVRSEAAVRGPFAATLTLTGVVRPMETVPLAAVSAGVVSYPARFATGLRTGEPVERGEVVATLESPATRLALVQARLQAEDAAVEVKHGHTEFDNGLLSAAQLAKLDLADRLARERLASAEGEARRLVLAAARKGRLMVSRTYPAGSEVAVGTLLAEVAADGPLRVEARAAASDRASLRPGLKARLRRPGERESTGSGAIREVAAVVEENGTVGVIAALEEATAMPLPGEGIEIDVDLDAHPDAVTVPEEAVVASAGGAGVFVVDAPTAWRGRARARRVAIVTGGRGGGRVEVRQGLDGGERVIVSGVAFLSDGATVAEAR